LLILSTEFLNDEKDIRTKVGKADKTLTVQTPRELLVNILFQSYWPNHASELRRSQTRKERDTIRLWKLRSQSQSYPGTALVAGWYQSPRQLPSTFQPVLPDWQQVGVPRCVCYCATDEVSGASVANWSLWPDMHIVEKNTRRSRFSPRILAGLADSIQTHRAIIDGFVNTYRTHTLQWQRRAAKDQFHRQYTNQYETLKHQNERALAFEGWSYAIKDPCHSCRGIYNYEVVWLLQDETVDAVWGGKDDEKGPSYGVCAKSAMHAGCLEDNDPLLLVGEPLQPGSLLDARNEAVHNACALRKKIQPYNRVIEPIPSEQQGIHLLSSREAQEANGKDRRTKQPDEPKASIAGSRDGKNGNPKLWLVNRTNLQRQWMSEDDITFLGGNIYKEWRQFENKARDQGKGRKTDEEDKGGPSRSKDRGGPSRSKDRGGPSRSKDQGLPSRSKDQGGPSREAEEGGGPQGRPDEADSGIEEGPSEHEGRKKRGRKIRKKDKGKGRKVD